MKSRLQQKQPQTSVKDLIQSMNKKTENMKMIVEQEQKEEDRINKQRKQDYFKYLFCVSNHSEHFTVLAREKINNCQNRTD